MGGNVAKLEKKLEEAEARAEEKREEIWAEFKHQDDQRKENYGEITKAFNENREDINLLVKGIHKLNNNFKEHTHDKDSHKNELMEVIRLLSGSQNGLTKAIT